MFLVQKEVLGTASLSYFMLAKSFHYRCFWSAVFLSFFCSLSFGSSGLNTSESVFSEDDIESSPTLEPTPKQEVLFYRSEVSDLQLRSYFLGLFQQKSFERTLFWNLGEGEFQSYHSEQGALRLFSELALTRYEKATLVFRYGLFGGSLPGTLKLQKLELRAVSQGSHVLMLGGNLGFGVGFGEKFLRWGMFIDYQGSFFRHTSSLSGFERERGESALLPGLYGRVLWGHWFVGAEVSQVAASSRDSFLFRPGLMQYSLGLGMVL